MRPRSSAALGLIFIAACGGRNAFPTVGGPDLALLGEPVRVLDPLLAMRTTSLGLAAGERILATDTEGPVRLSLEVVRLEAPLRIVLEPRAFPRERHLDSVTVEVSRDELSLAIGSRRELRPRARVSRPHGGKGSRLDLVIDASGARARYGTAEISQPATAVGPAQLVFSVVGDAAPTWPPHDAPVSIGEIKLAGATVTPRDALARANALLASGRPVEAAAVYSEALASGDLRAVRRGHALALLAAGRAADAALDLAVATTRDARLAPALSAAIDALLAAGDLPLAVETALEAWRYAPEDGASMARLQNVTERVRARAAHENDPVKRARAFAASRDVTDLALAEKALEGGADDVETHIARAQVLRFEAGVLRERKDEQWRSRYLRASSELSRARSLAPAEDERILTGLGIVSFILGQSGTAVSFLERAVKCDPDSYEAWFFLGRSRDDAASSVSALDRACAIRPFSSAARVYRAIARERAGDRAGARADLEAARELGTTPAHEVELSALAERLGR